MKGETFGKNFENLNLHFNLQLSLSNLNIFRFTTESQLLLLKTFSGHLDD